MRIVDPVQCATREAALLREEHHVDIVIGVTHMRMEEDMAVASRCSGVDLILGGHDHGYVLHGSQYTDDGGHAEGNIKIVKSGTDFRDFSVVKIHVERCHVGWRIRTVEGTLYSQLHTLAQSL